MTESPTLNGACTEWKGWRLFHHDHVPSTNDVARDCPPWSVVVAERQSGARGRYGRAWASSPGGLWLSAVLPITDPIQPWDCLPLVAGLALARTLNHFGLQTVRLRWPNDVMINDRKLAGILVERVDGPRAILGLGLNVTNQPADEDPALSCTATRLADHLKPVPAIDHLTHGILDELLALHATVEHHGFAPVAEQLQPYWHLDRPAEVTLPSGTLNGKFEGIAPDGSLLFRETNGTRHCLEASRVTLFRDTLNN